MVTIVSSSHLSLPRDELSALVYEQLTEALRVRNTRRDEQKRLNVPGWQKMPMHFKLWSEENGQLIMPRGFKSNLLRGLDAFDLAPFVDDRKTDVAANWSVARPINLRKHQQVPVNALIKSEEGIYEAPTGSGKTVTVLEAARRSGQKALVIVNTSNIAEQWRERAKTFLGIDAGLIGDGTWEIGDQLTIAMQQTLWSRHTDLVESGFYSDWGFVCLDECHHQSAETFMVTMSQFDARIRIGVSGTPDKGKMEYRLASAILGPIVHTTTDQELIDEGLLVMPKVQPINSGLKIPALHPDSKKAWQQLVKLIESDNLRAHVVAVQVASEPGCAHLILSRRLKHLEKMAEQLRLLGYPAEKIFMLTGKESVTERMDVAERIDEGDLVVLSTIADEALDVPRIDRVHLTWPTRKIGIVTQQIGRGMRPHPDKSEFVVYDYIDFDSFFTLRQWRERRKLAYDQRGIQVLELTQKEAVV